MGFILTAISVALLFAPWLYVPLHTAHDISKIWYVNHDFVLFSWQFFVNPLPPEIVQSVYFIATTLSASLFSFLLILGLVNARKLDLTPRRMIILTVGCFVLTYALLLVLSQFVRPMVTARYLKIFSVPLYLGSAVIIAKYKEIAKAVLVVLLIGFYFTYIDIRTISFDKGYQNAIQDVRKYISPDTPLLVTDNSNLFCEYFLPEYKCLLLHNGRGEILRLPKVADNLPYYDFELNQSVFSLSIYHVIHSADSCNEYSSMYRLGQNVRLCRFDNMDTVKDLLDNSFDFISSRTSNLKPQ